MPLASHRPGLRSGPLLPGWVPGLEHSFSLAVRVASPFLRGSSASLHTHRWTGCRALRAYCAPGAVLGPCECGAQAELDELLPQGGLHTGQLTSPFPDRAAQGTSEKLSADSYRSLPLATLAMPGSPSGPTGGSWL